MVLTCISLMKSDVERFFFHVSFGHLDVFFGEVSIMSFGHFFTGVFVFWVLSLISSLWILDTNPLSDMSFENIFSHSINCLLDLLFVSFSVQKPYIVMKSQ